MDTDSQNSNGASRTTGIKSWGVGGEEEVRREAHRASQSITQGEATSCPETDAAKLFRAEEMA